MNKSYKVAAVEYLNTAPFTYGLEKITGETSIEILHADPATCADMVLTGRADIGLLPVAVLENSSLVTSTNYGIACDGEVQSVLLVGEVPIQEMASIYLDYQSCTSNHLLMILLEELWDCRPSIIPSAKGYEQRIEKDTGGLIIGDRALLMSHRWIYTYDLGKAWKELTGLPFVFARWAGRSLPSIQMIETLEKSFEIGIVEVDEVIKRYSPGYPEIDVHHYLTQTIRHRITGSMEEGLDLFLNKISTIGV